MNINKLKKAAAVFGLVLAAAAVQPAYSETDYNNCCCKKDCAKQTDQCCCAVKSEQVSSGIVKEDFDLSVKPSDNFYEYAIGGWKKANPIPGDQARWGTFTILADNNYQLLHEILEQAAADPKTDLEKKLGKLYQSGMDQNKREKVGIAPLKSELKDIESIADRTALFNMIAYQHSRGLNPYFSLDSAQDDKNSSKIIATIWQAGLGLPERDYYIRTDDNSKKLRAQYVSFIDNMFRLAGYSAREAQKASRNVMDIETRLAKASLPAAEMRDPQKMYHLMSQNELSQLTPSFEWNSYYKIIGIDTPKEINVTGPEFMQAVGNLLSDKSLFDKHKDYLAWRIIVSGAPFLTKDFEECSFNFYSKTLRGIKVMKPQWKRVTGVVDNLMGHGLGQLYVKKAFSPESKQKVQNMVKNITAYMADDIPTLDWMSDTTKHEALKKLHAFKAKIGYPDKPRDYSKLEITDSYYDNMRNASRFEKQRTLAKIGKPVDPNDWYMAPQEVNAYYSPCDNEIVFPAGILQPPFFDPKADDATNYGGIGMVIGHEISHGFDDQGAQYDGQGNLRNWWTAEDKVKFDKLTKGVEDQFSSYVVQGQNLNGKLVLGESIADLSGLALAWGAYQKSLNGSEGQVIDGYTPAQRFFLNYAKIWAINMSPEMEKLQINTDPHPPAKWRVNGPLSNMEVFFQAFDVPEGSPMCRPVDKRNKIW
ncbi:MAG: M13 family metallopeptidase [Candidatus Bruticola sp.]